MADSMQKIIIKRCKTGSWTVKRVYSPLTVISETCWEKVFSLWRWRTRPQLWERCLPAGLRACPPSAAPPTRSRQTPPVETCICLFASSFVDLTNRSPSGEEPSVFISPSGAETDRGKPTHLPERVDTPRDGCSEICRQSHHQEPRRPAAHLGNNEAWKWVRLNDGFGNGSTKCVVEEKKDECVSWL